jgi:hypothetical protein
MRTEQNTKAKKKAMLEALEKTLGVISTACKKCGIYRTTHYQWMKDDPEYADSVNSMDEFALDFVETAHYKNIQEGNASNIIFHLKTKGKKRGYTEEMIVKHHDENEILDDLEPEEIKQVMDIVINARERKNKK